MDPLTVLIIIIAGVSFYAWENQDVMHKLMFSPTSVKDRKEYYRFLTSGFVHSDYFHLGVNLFVLWNFGDDVQNEFQKLFGDMGNFHLISLFLFGVVVSEIPTFLRYQNAPYYRSLGASGGVSSVMFTFILLFPTRNLYLFLSIPLPAIIYAIGYLAYSSYQDKRSGDNINHSAHFWGSVFGLVYPLIFKPNLAIRFFEQLFS